MNVATNGITNAAIKYINDDFLRDPKDTLVLKSLNLSGNLLKSETLKNFSNIFRKLTFQEVQNCSDALDEIKFDPAVLKYPMLKFITLFYF